MFEGYDLLRNTASCTGVWQSNWQLSHKRNQLWPTLQPSPRLHILQSQPYNGWMQPAGCYRGNSVTKRRMVSLHLSMSLSFVSLLRRVRLTAITSFTQQGKFLFRCPLSISCCLFSYSNFTIYHAHYNSIDYFIFLNSMVFETTFWLVNIIDNVITV